MNQQHLLHEDNPQSTKAQLDAELSSLTFTDAMAEQVVLAARRKVSFWERQILIPVPAAAIILLLLIGTAVFPAFVTPHQDSQKLVVTEAGVFDEKLLTRRAGE